MELDVHGYVGGPITGSSAENRLDALDQLGVQIDESVFQP